MLTTFVMNSTVVPFPGANRNQVGVSCPDEPDSSVIPPRKRLGSSTSSQWKSSVVTSSPLSPPPFLPHATSLLRAQTLPPPTVPSSLPIFASPSKAPHAPQAHNLNTPSNSDTTPPSLSHHGPTHFYPSPSNLPKTTQPPLFAFNESRPQNPPSHGTPTATTNYNSSPSAVPKPQSNISNFPISTTISLTSQPSHDQKQSHGAGSLLPSLTNRYSLPTSQEQVQSYQPHFQFPPSQTVTRTTVPLATNLSVASGDDNNIQTRYILQASQEHAQSSYQPRFQFPSSTIPVPGTTAPLAPNLPTSNGGDNHTQTRYNVPTSQERAQSPYQPRFQFPSNQTIPTTSSAVQPVANFPTTSGDDNNMESLYYGRTMRLSHHKTALYDISKLLSSGCAIIEGRVYNDKGHNICGVMNQHDKPCKRIGKCPFHTMPTAVTQFNSCNGYVDAHGNAATSEPPSSSHLLVENTRPQQTGRSGEHSPSRWHAGRPLSQDVIMRQRRDLQLEYNLTSSPEESASTTTTLRGYGKVSIQRDVPGERTVAPAVNGPRPPRKVQYKHGWSKDEHFMFLRGLQKYKRGSWKQISQFVKTRTPTQVQSHAQKYFLRQRQHCKNKRSIHDLSIDSPEMKEVARRLQLDTDPPLKGEFEACHMFDPLPDEREAYRMLESERMGLPSNMRGPSTSSLHHDLNGTCQRGLHSGGSNVEFPRNFVMTDHTIRVIQPSGPGDSTIRAPVAGNVLEQRQTQVESPNVHGLYTERRLVGSSWAYGNTDSERFYPEERLHSSGRSEGLYRGLAEGFEGLATTAMNGGFSSARVHGSDSNANFATGQRDVIATGSRITTGLVTRGLSAMRASQGVAPAGSIGGVGARHM